jgi:hypothetical protein
VHFVSPETGMSAQEALATACHLANVDAREVVIIDLSDLWRPEWGTLYLPKSQRAALRPHRLGA